jgi:antibiotic biosynthesis monooxygenase (ABM) superfamily enzyme
MTSAVSEAGFSLVSQIRVLADRSDEFIRWVERVNDVIGAFPDFVEQVSLPPSPPIQVDWVITQRFSDADAVRGWLQSSEWQRLTGDIQPSLVGPFDVHLITESDAGIRTAPVLAVIYMRVPSAHEVEFLRWQRRIAAAEARFEGFRGYKLEPPLAGVQDEWVMLVRFDSDAHLEAWLNSEQRRQLLAETAAFAGETHYRKIRGGYEFWFTSGDGDTRRPPPPWKQNMLVLLALYPVAYLYTHWVGTPLLVSRGVPVWGSVFFGNCISVPLTGYLLVPQARRGFRWWLNPPRYPDALRDWAGAGLAVLLYSAWLLLFSRLPF